MAFYVQWGLSSQQATEVRLRGRTEHPEHARVLVWRQPLQLSLSGAKQARQPQQTGLAAVARKRVLLLPSLDARVRPLRAGLLHHAQRAQLPRRPRRRRRQGGRGRGPEAEVLQWGRPPGPRPRRRPGRPRRGAGGGSPADWLLFARIQTLNWVLVSHLKCFSNNFSKTLLKLGNLKFLTPDV